MNEPDPSLSALSQEVIGAAIEVHRSLGPGFLESVYEEALCIELDLRSVSYQRQLLLPLKYKGRNIGEHRLDLLVEGRLVVELKAVESLLPIHKAQVISYLKATSCQLGLLINFNTPVLKDGVKRIILSD